MGEQPQERSGYVTPTRELERRWSLVREAMDRQGIDCLVIQNELGAMGGYVRYFTDSVANPYRTTVLFPAKEDMFMIDHGSPASNVYPPFFKPRGLQGNVLSPYVQTFNFAQDYAARAAVDFIRDHGFKTLGWVAMTNIDAAFYRYLTESLPDCEFVDASDLVDRIKAVKGPDEIESIRQTIELHDRIIGLVPEFARPGRYEFEIRSDLIKASLDLKSEEQNIMVGRHPRRSAMFPPNVQTQKLQSGDVLTCLVEISGQEGIFAEVGRIFCLGEPPKALLKAYETSVEAQRLIASQMKPGADPVQIYEAANAFLVSRGYNREERIVAHGQGYDMVERPAVAPGETMVLEENMLIAIHCGAHNADGGASSTDNYLITADGANLLTQTPQKIIVI